MHNIVVHGGLTKTLLTALFRVTLWEQMSSFPMTSLLLVRHTDLPTLGSPEMFAKMPSRQASQSRSQTSGAAAGMAGCRASDTAPTAHVNYCPDHLPTSYEDDVESEPNYSKRLEVAHWSDNVL